MSYDSYDYLMEVTFVFIDTQGVCNPLCLKTDYVVDYKIIHVLFGKYMQARNILKILRRRYEVNVTF